MALLIAMLFNSTFFYVFFSDHGLQDRFLNILNNTYVIKHLMTDWIGMECAGFLGLCAHLEDGGVGDPAFLENQNVINLNLPPPPILWKKEKKCKNRFGQ